MPILRRLWAKSEVFANLMLGVLYWLVDDQSGTSAYLVRSSADTTKIYRHVMLWLAEFAMTFHSFKVYAVRRVLRATCRFQYSEVLYRPCRLATFTMSERNRNCRASVHFGPQARKSRPIMPTVITLKIAVGTYANRPTITNYNSGSVPMSDWAQGEAGLR